jgi:hypothetical protein
MEHAIQIGMTGRVSMSSTAGTRRGAQRTDEAWNDDFLLLRGLSGVRNSTSRVSSSPVAIIGKVTHLTSILGPVEISWSASAARGMASLLDMTLI